MIKFDPTKPYTTVHGLPGLAYQQDGCTFNGRGELVEDTTTINRIDIEEKEPEDDPDVIPKCYEQKEEEIPTKYDTNFESLHWKQLQILLRTYGEEYTNRDEAIAFLKGKK